MRHITRPRIYDKSMTFSLQKDPISMQFLCHMIKSHDKIIKFNSFLPVLMKDLLHFDKVYVYFADASQNFPMYKISLVPF